MINKKSPQLFNDKKSPQLFNDKKNPQSFNDKKILNRSMIKKNPQSFNDKKELLSIKPYKRDLPFHERDYGTHTVHVPESSRAKAERERDRRQCDQK